MFTSKGEAERYLDLVRLENLKAARRERFMMHAEDIEWEPGTVPVVEIGPEGIEVKR